jgi:hypothetical protein
MLKTTAAGKRRTQTHVTILSKAGMLALITFTVAPDGALITSSDPRQPKPKSCRFKTPLAAVASHTQALATTMRWRLADHLQRAGAAGVAAKKRAADNLRPTTE